MREDFVIILAALAFGCLCGVIGGAIADRVASTHYKRGAVERGYAMHCPADGEWAWKGECGEELK